MIIQRKVNIVTSNKTLDYSEIGDVICEGSLTLNLPNPKMGLWYTFRQVTDHTTIVAGTQIKLNEEVTFIADDSTWYMTKGGSSGGGGEPSSITVHYEETITYYISKDGNEENSGLSETTPLNNIDVIFNRLNENSGSEIYVRCEIYIEIIDDISMEFSDIRSIPGYDNNIRIDFLDLDIYMKGLSISDCNSPVEIYGAPGGVIDILATKGGQPINVYDLNIHTGANRFYGQVYEHSSVTFENCVLGQSSYPTTFTHSDITFNTCTFLANTEPLFTARNSNILITECDLSATNGVVSLINSNYEIIEDQMSPGNSGQPVVRAPKPEPEKVLMTDIDGLTYWGEPATGGSIPLATITNDGLMASTDKQLLADLDSIAHEHGNISVIEELSDIGGSLAYLGEVVGSGGGGSSAPGLKLRITNSDFTVTSTTMSDVSELAFTMEAGKSYKIDVVLRYRGAATTTGGKFGFYSKSPGYCFITGFLEGAITSAAAATALKVPIRVCYNNGDADSFITTTGVNSTSKDHIIHGTCYIVCEDTGVFQPCWGSEVSGSGATLIAGSMLSYQEVS